MVYIQTPVDNGPRYVKRQRTFSAVQWNGTPEVGQDLIKRFNNFGVRVTLDFDACLQLELLGTGGVWERVDHGYWILITSEYHPKHLGPEFEVLSPEEFKKQYEQIKE